ncbi:hypothetical protein CXF80_13090 [Shewanella sp. Actino-trap-3]|jgi:hypothetical protein|uniref:hypothetical protein n=1 Tax=Shewanella sp. Actino-trap-3 TaxID=2058331 RepID=UPI000C339730|nr:hypothetical protein [Shewanella sp. Actino-trap-3]PKG79165.1 hypothetical protein CXF80_13090 [Shewanella sp. Actino-trap-3]
MSTRVLNGTEHAAFKGFTITPVRRGPLLPTEIVNELVGNMLGRLVSSRMQEWVKIPTLELTLAGAYLWAT